MSVINQMLKDLEERAPASENSTNSAVIIAPKSSPIKLVAIIIGTLLLCNLLAWYVWSVIAENKSLKAEAKLSTTNRQTAHENRSTVVPERLAVNNTVKPAQAKQETQEVIKTSNEPSHLQGITSQSSANQLSTSNSQAKTLESSRLKNTARSTTSSEVVAVDKKTTELTNLKTAMVDKADVSNKASPPAKMTVSRRQFTSTELVSQKLAQAEQAIASDNIPKAEALYEDVLIIDPLQTKARKKLAALWFGRQAGQEANNLLSQGIALTPNNSDLRMLQAQIYLKLNNPEFALKTLMPLVTLEQTEYQYLIANTAQQLANFDVAINAYTILLKLQPNNARLHLGLAIVHDKNSQFDLAVQHYQSALALGGLSSSSATFVSQRMQVLGE